MSRRVADYPPGFEPPPASPFDLGPVVEQALLERRACDRIFGRSFSAGTGWDILLEVAAADAREKILSVTDIGLRAKLPCTTVIYNMSKLESAGLIERRPDLSDRRRTFVHLTPKGVARLRAFAEAIAEARELSRPALRV